MARGSPDSCDSLVGSRKLLPLVPANSGPQAQEHPSQKADDPDVR